MTTSHRIFHRFILPLLTLTLGALAASCVNYAFEGTRDEIEGSGNVWLSFQIKGMDEISPQSRAGNPQDPAGHPSEKADAAEKYINFADLQLIVFGADNRVITTLAIDDFILTGHSPDYSSYELKARIHRSLFDYAGGSVAILAVANTKGINRDDLPYDSYADATFHQSLDNLTSSLRGFGYDGLAAPGSSIPWTPDIEAGRHVPMSGLARFAIDDTALDNATSPTTALPLSSIVMQRTMAKIRVLDGIKFQTALPAPTEIISVRFCSGTTMGAYVPPTALFPRWAQGTAILESAPRPTPATSWNDVSLKIPTYKGGAISATDGTGSNRIYDSAFLCYTPETAVRSLSATTVRPYLEITTSAQDPGGKAPTVKTHTVFLDQWMSSLATTPDLVRNHIFQFIVTQSEKSDLKVDYTICDWNNVTSGDISFN